MSWRKIIIYGFLASIVFVTIQRVIVNFCYFDNYNLLEGKVETVEVFTGVDGYSTRRSFYLCGQEGKRETGVNSEKDKWFVKEGDRVLYRKLYNGSVRIVEVNGKKSQNYYEVWDYLSLVLLIAMIAIYVYLKKK